MPLGKIVNNVILLYWQVFPIMSCYLQQQVFVFWLMDCILPYLLPPPGCKLVQDLNKHGDFFCSYCCSLFDVIDQLQLSGISPEAATITFLFICIQMHDFIFIIVNNFLLHPFFSLRWSNSFPSGFWWVFYDQSWWGSENGWWREGHDGIAAVHQTSWCRHHPHLLCSSSC